MSGCAVVARTEGVPRSRVEGRIRLSKLQDSRSTLYYFRRMGSIHSLDILYQIGQRNPITCLQPYETSTMLQENA